MQDTYPKDCMGGITNEEKNDCSLMAVMMTMSLAACGSSAGSSDASGTGSAATGDNSAAQAASGDKVTLNLCWWGNRQEMM